MVQLVFAASVTPDRLTLVAPAVAVKLPPQVLLTLKPVGGLATVICTGKFGSVSVKATPLMGLFWLGLVIVNDSLDVPPGMIGESRNFLTICGGASMVNCALPEPLLPLLVPVSLVGIGPGTVF